MENGKIQDEQITAASELSSEYAAKNSRLNNEESAWIAWSKDFYQWLQIDLLRNTKITGVATQGGGDLGLWVPEYRLSYSYDEVNFHYYMEQGQTTPKVKVYCLTDVQSN